MAQEIKPNRCCEMIWRGNVYRQHQCARRWNLVERDGKMYCKQHDPEEVERRRVERVAKWDAKREVRRAAAAQDRLIHATHPKLVELARLGAKLAGQAALAASCPDPIMYTDTLWEMSQKYSTLLSSLKADGIDVTKENA